MAPGGLRRRSGPHSLRGGRGEREMDVPERRGKVREDASLPSGKMGCQEQRRGSGDW